MTHDTVPTRASRRALLLLLAALILPGLARAEATLTNEQILRGFEKVAFNLEEGAWSHPGITRWPRPVLIAVGGEGYQPYLEFIQAKIDELAWVTRHEVKIVRFDQANTLMVFTHSVVDDVGTRHRGLFGDLFGHDDRRIDAKVARLRATDTVCYFGSAVSPANPYEITYARIFISTGIERRHMLHCIMEELAQMMGLFNDSVSLDQSIFNDRNNSQVGLPEHDKMLLRILYDHRIRPGMTVQQALPVARQILEEVRPNDTLPWAWR